MFPEMTGKKVYTEDEKEIGVITDIKPDEFGSFLAIIQTKFEEFPKFEVPVTRLRKRIKGSEEFYILRTIPFKLKMLIEGEIEEVAEQVTTEIPLAPEVPPIEKFLHKKEEAPSEGIGGVPEEERSVEGIQEEEKIETEKLAEPEVKEVVVEEEKEQVIVKEEKKGFFDSLKKIFSSIISAIKNIFKKK